MENLMHVDATLNYQAETSKRPVTYQYAPPPRSSAEHPQRMRGPSQSMTRVLSKRIWPSISGLQLHYRIIPPLLTSPVARAGARDLLSGWSNWWKDATGATRTLVFDHIVRSVPKLKRGETGVKSPATSVHNDYAASREPQRIWRNLRRGRGRRAPRRRSARDRRSHRFAVHCWLRRPIAVCGRASISLKDFVASNLVYCRSKGRVYARFSHNSGHRWYYFSENAG